VQDLPRSLQVVEQLELLVVALVVAVRLLKEKLNI